jgi:phage prohead protease, HK97 family
MSTPERRYYLGEVRAITPDGSGDTRIVGYGAVFNKRSENLGGFREIIMPGAFDSCLKDDVRALFNHDSNIILGRTTSNTLTLSKDDNGLSYEIMAPDTQMIKDMVLAPMARGDITQSSFQFTVARDGENWYQDDEGIVIREIHQISRLFDIGPVTFPAYPDATSAKRNLDEFLSNQKELQKALTSKRSRERYLTVIGG